MQKVNAAPVTRMIFWKAMAATPNRRIAAVALGIIGFDQLTKLLVLQFLGFEQDKVVIPGFFKFVHWGNTGAAWSLLTGNNGLLAVIAVIALIVLVFSRHHFDSRTFLGQLAFGFIFGGIVGNLIDRLRWGHVIDFLYFYVERPGGPVGFPAFNVADSAICTGVALVFIVTWLSDKRAPAEDPSAPDQKPVGTLEP
jgi:signal peptidase II